MFQTMQHHILSLEGSGSLLIVYAMLWQRLYGGSLLTIQNLLSMHRTVAGLLSPRRMRSIPSGASALSGLDAGTNLTGRSLKELFVYKVCRPSIRPALFILQYQRLQDAPARARHPPSLVLKSTQRRMTLLRRGKAFPRNDDKSDLA